MLLESFIATECVLKSLARILGKGKFSPLSLNPDQQKEALWSFVQGTLCLEKCSSPVIADVSSSEEQQ